MTMFFKAAFAAILIAGMFVLFLTERAKHEEREHEKAKRAAVERVLERALAPECNR